MVKAGSLCETCGVEFEWGEFARKQDVCWGCTRTRAVDILRTLTGEDRELFIWAMSIVAERYGYEF